MGDAFQCDDCGDFFPGEPEEKVYNKEHIDRQGTDIVLRAELCEGCSESFARASEDDAVTVSDLGTDEGHRGGSDDG